MAAGVCGEILCAMSFMIEMRQGVSTNSWSDVSDCLYVLHFPIRITFPT